MRSWGATMTACAALFAAGLSSGQSGDGEGGVSLGALADPVSRWETRTVTIDLHNRWDREHAFALEATLSDALLFAGASHGGRIAEPDRIETSRRLIWPALRLAAGDREQVSLQVHIASDGPFTLDVHAGDPAQRLAFGRDQIRGTALDPDQNQRDDSRTSGGLILAALGVLVFGSLLALGFGASWGLGAVCIAGAALAGLIGFGLVRTDLEARTAFEPTRCEILDRRVQQVRSVGKRSSVRMAPVAAVRYFTRDGERVSHGFTGFGIGDIAALAALPPGVPLECRVHRRDVRRFSLLTGTSAGALIAGTLLLALAGVLLFAAFRLWPR